MSNRNSRELSGKKSPRSASVAMSQSDPIHKNGAIKFCFFLKTYTFKSAVAALSGVKHPPFKILQNNSLEIITS